MPAAPSALHPDLPDLADPDSILRNGRRLDTDTCHKRLLFRNWHRGAQEIDLILASFAERCLTASTVHNWHGWKPCLIAATSTYSTGSPVVASRRSDMTTT